MVYCHSLGAQKGSVGPNRKFIAQKCGVVPVIIIEGAPSQGKSTQTTAKKLMWGITTVSSIIDINGWSSSALTSVRDKLPGISITYGLLLFPPTYISFICCMHSADDLDHENINDKKVEGDGFVMSQTNSGAEITIKHGIRCGATSITVAICNNAESVIDFEDAAVASRGLVLNWDSHLDTLSNSAKEESLNLLEEHFDDIKHKTVDFLNVVAWDKYSEALTEVRAAITSFASPDEQAKVYDHRSYAFKAAMLVIIKNIRDTIIEFPEEIIMPTLTNLYRFEFAKLKAAIITGSAGGKKKSRRKKPKFKPVVYSEKDVLDFVAQWAILLECKYAALELDETATEKWQGWVETHQIRKTRSAGHKVYAILCQIGVAVVQYFYQHLNKSMFDKYGGLPTVKDLFCVLKAAGFAQGSGGRNQKLMQALTTQLDASVPHKSRPYWYVIDKEKLLSLNGPPEADGNEIDGKAEDNNNDEDDDNNNDKADDNNNNANDENKNHPADDNNNDQDDNKNHKADDNNKHKDDDHKSGDDNNSDKAADNQDDDMSVPAPASQNVVQDGHQQHRFVQNQHPIICDAQLNSAAIEGNGAPKNNTVAGTKRSLHTEVADNQPNKRRKLNEGDCL